MTTHLSTPAAPRIAACGDAGAKRFTFWRWKATCALCKASTAAVSFEKLQHADAVYRTDLPVRYTALVKFVREHGGTESAILEFERDKNIACSVCPTCKMDLSDPIALMDVKQNRIVFACPGCSPSLRERWEKEA